MNFFFFFFELWFNDLDPQDISLTEPCRQSPQQNITETKTLRHVNEFRELKILNYRGYIESNIYKLIKVRATFNFCDMEIHSFDLKTNQRDSNNEFREFKKYYSGFSTI